MKVLRKGKPTNWTYHRMCTKCKALLEIESTDCRRVSDQRDGDYFACYCPECNHPIHIAASLITK